LKSWFLSTLLTLVSLIVVFIKCSISYILTYQVCITESHMHLCLYFSYICVLQLGVQLAQPIGTAPMNSVFVGTLHVFYACHQKLIDTNLNKFEMLMC